MESLFTGFIPLALLLAFAFFVTVTLHELGHAIPALLMTRGEVTIYIGSLGNPYKGFHISIGRLSFYCKYNPLLWYKGCCIAHDYDLSIDQRILYIAGGPVASLIGTLCTWLFISVAGQHDFLRILAGSVFIISLTITVAILIPDTRARYTPSGYAVYSDTYQIFKLLRRKYR